MTPAQTSLYFFHWGKVRQHYLAKGIDPKQVDAKRHELHIKALGGRKSSKDFTNADLDKVIATFRAIYDGGNFDAQMRQQEQPDERRRALIGRCWKAMRSFLDFTSENQFQRAADGYANATSKRIHGVGLDHLTEAQLAVVMGALERSAAVKSKKKEHAATVTAPADNYSEEDDPFA